MVEAKVKSMIRAYRLAMSKSKNQKKKKGKKSRIPFLDKMEEVFGDTNIINDQPSASKTKKKSVSRVRPSSTLLLSKQDQEESSGDDEDDDDEDIQDEFICPPTPPKAEIIMDPREAGRNARFERKLKFIEELERKREKIKERRFNELLEVIRKTRK